MISVTGVKEIDQVFKHLPENVTHKILGSAHFAAAKPLVEKEKQLAPRGATNNLVESIGAVRTAQSKARSIGEVKVGPRRKGGYKGFAGHLNEFGTKSRRTKNGANRGVMPSKPFARPAFTATKGQIELGINTQIGKSMIRTMKRYLK